MDHEMRGARRISSVERSGVLTPSNLERFAASWIAPGPAVRDVVDTYWTVSWRLQPGEVIHQRILEFPAITLSIERGQVPAPMVVTGVHARAWIRDIRGTGDVFAIRLRPAGLRVVSDLAPARLRDDVVTGEALDDRVRRVLAAIAGVDGALERARVADTVIDEALRERPLSTEQRCANRVLDALASDARSPTGSPASGELGLSPRTMQRALAATLGMGPKRVARRIRLQEVARRLSEPASDAAAVAAELGYVDQAHLVNDFRSVAGVTPGRYLAELRGLSG